MEWSLNNQFPNCRPNPSAVVVSANSCTHSRRRRDATRQLSRVGVGGVLRIRLSNVLFNQCSILLEKCVCPLKIVYICFWGKAVIQTPTGALLLDLAGRFWSCRYPPVYWSEFVTNDEIRCRTGQPFLSDTVRSRRLSFIGHLYRADPGQDHHRALQACISDRAHLTVGDGGLDVQGNPGSEPWRPTCSL